MKEKLAALGRKVFGRHAHRLGLDARPVEHVLRPLTRIQKHLHNGRAHNVDRILDNHDEIDRRHADNVARRGELTKGTAVLRNLSALLEE